MQKSLTTGTLLQPCVLRLGSLQDWDVGVGVFPEGEEVLISPFSFIAIAGEDVGAGGDPDRIRCTRRLQEPLHDGQEPC
jgi:hypothetical protein